MSSYLPPSELTDLLPSSHGLDAGQLAECITVGSEFVDSSLAHLYWTPFTDYSASPAATPPYVVRKAAVYFAASEAYHKMAALNLLDDDSGAAKRCRDAALEILEPFIKGEQQLAPETATDTLISTSWGDGDPYSSDQAPLSISGGEYVEGSARFSSATDWQLGIDFWINYYAPRRQWVITRGDSTIGDGTGAPGDAGDVLTYSVSRLRKRESVQPGIQSVELFRG